MIMHTSQKSISMEYSSIKTSKTNVETQTIKYLKEISLIYTDSIMIQLEIVFVSSQNSTK